MSNVLVVGANRGIGFELTKSFLARKDNVFATTRSSSAELTATGATVVEGVDVREKESIARLNDALGHSSLDVVVLNAGVLSQERLGSIDFDAVRHQFEVNAMGPLRLAEGLVPRMSKASKLVIVTSRMGSMADNGSGGSYGYRMSKAAVNAAGRSLAMDLKERGIAVLLVHPGYVRTDMTSGNGHIDPDESAAGIHARIDELNLNNTGRFMHQNGEELPW